MTSSPQLSEALAKLRERFAATSGNTIAAFAQLADQLQRTPAAPAVVDALRRELHRVHGTAGSYGFHEASRLAGALELVAVRWAADPALDASRRGTIVRQFVHGLSSAIRSTPAADSPLARRLLLIGLDDDLAMPLVTEGVHRGHFVERATVEQLPQLLDAGLPQVVVARANQDLNVPEGVALLLLRRSGEEIVAHGAQARVLDATTEASDVLQVVESLAAHTGLAGSTILAIDDDPAMLDLLRSIGEAEGIFVVTLESAGGLDAAILEHQPALLLLDISMPGESGLAVIGRIRREPAHAGLPILVVSAQVDADTRTAVFTLGADDFQPKPIVAVELTRRIGRLLELRRQRLVARGVHPATGLWLFDRAVRSFDETLHAAAAAGAAASLAFLRPRDPPAGLHGAALWHRECALVAAALGVDGAQAGFLDEATLLVLFPFGSVEAVARLESFAEASEQDEVPWCAGVAELRVTGEASSRALQRRAEEGWLAARDAGVSVRRWDEADAGIAPDVLIVEDDVALADLLSFALTARGLSHRVYHTGPEALEGLRTLRVHERRPLILLDVDLPGLDGFSLFERLREERPGAFRVVFISVHASEGDQLRAIRAGALDYLAKPLSLRILMAKIALWRDQGRPQ